MGGIQEELSGSVVQEGFFSGTTRDLSAVRRAKDIRGASGEPEPTGDLLATIPLQVRPELIGDLAVELVMKAFPGAELVSG